LTIERHAPRHAHEPRAEALAIAEPRKAAVRFGECLLRDVLGVVFVACQPARQIVRGIQVRHNRLFETRLLILFFQSFFPSVRVTSSIQDRCAPEFIPVIITFYPGIFNQPGRYV